MTAQTSFLSPSRIRPDIRAMLEYHILEDLPLRTACQMAGLPYHKNVSQHKSSKAGKAFVAWLMGRRRVISEFGVDDPALVKLIELRDEALEAGSHVAAVRANELCLKASTEAKENGKGVGDRKDVDKMTREELLDEMLKLKMKADGEGFDVDEDPRDAAFWESVGRAK